MLPIVAIVNPQGVQEKMKIGAENPLYLKSGMWQLILILLARNKHWSAYLNNNYLRHYNKERFHLFKFKLKVSCGYK